MNSQKNVIVGIGLVLVCCSASVAYAGQWQGLTFTPRVSVAEVYDNNITQLQEDEISDFRTDLLLGMHVTREEKVRRLDLDATIARQTFFDNNDFDNTASALQLDYVEELTKYDRLTISENFNHSQEPTTLAENFGNINGRYSRYGNRFSLDYSHETSSRFVWHVKYANDYLNNSDKARTDSMMHSIGAGLEKALSSVNTLSADYVFRHKSFEPGASAYENEASANWRHYFTSQIYSDVQSGLNYVHDYEGKDKAYPLYRASVTQDLDEKTRIDASLEKAYSATSYAQDVFNSWRFSANVMRQFLSRVVGNGSLFYGEGKYAETGSETDFQGVSLGMGIEATKNTTVRLSYSYLQQHSSENTGTFDRKTVFLGLITKF